MFRLELLIEDTIQANSQCTHNYRNLPAQQLVVYCNKRINDSQCTILRFLIHEEGLLRERSERLERACAIHQKGGNYDLVVLIVQAEE